MDQVDQVREDLLTVEDFICHAKPGGIYEDYESIPAGSALARKKDRLSLAALREVLWGQL